ncbi:tape measure domain protein (plasmid) [Borreliella burgdorferi 156a]|uniref:Tape measure domain protein n=2 Tax=Borreliella burgdorferi TaxID=139 RepID=A0A7U3YB27_BORBG|nr:tape measure domain protein [Borreliella burgdorferi 156a]ACN92785.1 tape measure domain protein [Borreliella burgdorferi 118a]
MSISNNQKLDAIAETLKKIAEQKFSSLDDLKSKLEKSAKSGSNLEKALNKSSQNASKNFKSLADSVDSVNSKAGSMKSIGKVLKSVGKGLGSVKNLANKTGEAFNQMLAAFAPIIIAVKAIQAIGSTISGIFDGAMDALDEFNEEVSTFSDMLGNEDLGKSLAESMRAFGDETLFTRDAIANATKTMLSYGATASEVEERIRMFGEAAGGSSEGLEKLAEVYSRVESSNQVNLEDLYALRDAGVDITDILAEEAGLAGEALYKAASDGKIGFDALNKALSKATSEGGKFYGNTAKEAKTLAQAQQQTAKMSEKLFLDIGKALEPMMIGFEKVKQFLIKGILEPLTKVTSGVIYLIQKLTELVVYVSSKLVEGFKIAFDPIIKLFQKAVEMAGKLTENIKKIFGLSKKSEEEKNEKDAASSEPERLKKFDPSAINDFNKQIIEDNKNLQEEIFLRRREIALKPIEQQEKATREFEAWVNKKNKEFIAKYGKSFDQLTDENKRILVGVETAVNEFAKANHDFANNYKNLQKEMEKRHREILTLPYKEQEKALKELNADINKKNKAFIAKYGKSFETLNESNRQVVVALEKQVNEFEKTALDRTFVEAHKAMQDKITNMQWQILLLPLEEQEKASKAMQAEIQKLHADFVKTYESEFHNLNDTNKNTLMQSAKESQEKLKGYFEGLGDILFGHIDKWMGQIFNKDMGESLGEDPDKFMQNMGKVAFDVSKDVIKGVGAAFGPIGDAIAGVVTALMDFLWGWFKGREKARIQAIEKKRDEDLKELEKQSEVELKKLEERFDAEIKMRKEKLSELDDEYTKEIEFLKQAQSKGQISGEEFQKRLHDVQTEYKTKKDTATAELTKTEETKKIEVERRKKLSELEPEKIKAQAEVDKVETMYEYWGKDDDLQKAQKILDEILKRIAKVKSAGSIEEIKLAHGGARFVSNKPTYMPNSGVMSSEFGQPELVRITPAPIDENLRKLEAKIIAEEITKLQKTQSSTVVNNFYYNFNGDVLDAEKLVRMLKSKEHLMGFRMAE